MKKQLLFAFVLTTTLSQAQMTSSNEPAIGETIDMYVLDSNATNYSGVTGTGVTWDYSMLAGYNGTTSTMEVLDPATLPSTVADSFPGATKVIQIGGTLETFFSSTTSDRNSQGFHMYDAGLGDILAMFTNDDQLIVTYPFDFGSTIQDNYDGNVSLSFNGIPVYSPISGQIDATIDGTGTLKFPGGVDVANVMRYYSSDIATTTLPVLGAVDVIKTQYEYYDHATQNLPVFAHITITLVQSGSTVPIQETHLVLSKYGTSDNVSVNEISEIEFQVAPNPTENSVKVFGEFSANAVAMITDQSGRVLNTFDVVNGASVDMTSFANGIYMMTIKDNGLTTTKTIVKK